MSTPLAAFLLTLARLIRSGSAALELYVKEQQKLDSRVT